MFEKFEVSAPGAKRQALVETAPRAVRGGRRTTALSGFAPALNFSRIKTINIGISCDNWTCICYELGRTR